MFCPGCQQLFQSLDLNRPQHGDISWSFWPWATGSLCGFCAYIRGVSEDFFDDEPLQQNQYTFNYSFTTFMDRVHRSASSEVARLEIDMNERTGESRTILQAFIYPVSGRYNSPDVMQITSDYTGSPNSIEFISPGSETVRVITINNQWTSHEPCRYATLSYRWGKDPKFYKLTAETMHTIFTALPLVWLPKTFRDAIQMTWALGLRYLWIDALCIVQGSEEDWNKEAPQMAHVYGNSFVSLAATSSDDAEGGLLFQRWPPMINGIQVQLKAGKSQWEEVLLTCGPKWASHIEDSFLNQRAWVFQERVLAPRTIHFAKEQLYWECHEATSSEQNPNNILQAIEYTSPIHRLRQSLVGLRHESQRGTFDTKWLWDDIITAFNPKLMTSVNDKLMALSGIANHIAQYRPYDQYLAGIWSSHLQSSLMWEPTRRVGTRCIRSSNASTPTWSWASVDGVVTTRGFDLRGGFAEILDAKTFPTGDRLGPVQGGYLVVRSRLCKALLTPGIIPANSDTSYFRAPAAPQKRTLRALFSSLVGELTSNGTNSNALVYQRVPGGMVLVHLDDDNAFERLTPDRIFYLLELIYQPLAGDAVSVGLVLEPTTSPGQYRRIGTFNVHIGQGDVDPNIYHLWRNPSSPSWMKINGGSDEHEDRNGRFWPLPLEPHEYCGFDGVERFQITIV